ncbi:hypothetical protein HELRODRAFT_178249 [Helobdella robusta]|uniref:Uncharacterized protein n=1 Tax=Helobdella robusta TaxID=6412 RepID=T1FCZ8_HELRO|nr:hypothetical protein HELRODRAFT_178249 [Helobdella robusta]ESN97447.1 hypothetical protein HELRODRAFT_178249 [Helobdella robusta]
MGPRGCIALVSCAALNSGKYHTDTGSALKIQLLASSTLYNLTLISKLEELKTEGAKASFRLLNQMTLVDNTRYQTVQEKASAVTVFYSRLGNYPCYWVQTAATNYTCDGGRFKMKLEASASNFSTHKP